MNYKINERFFEKVLKIKKDTDDIGEDIDELRRYLATHANTDEESLMFIFSGYLRAMEEGAELANVKLDMTYDTIENVMPAVIATAIMQSKSENYQDNRHNAEITMKTLAAYLTMMAANNHGAKIKVDKKGNSRESRPELWSDRYYLRINNKRDSDFLPYAIEGLDSTPIEVDNGFAVDINPLIGAYLRLTNVNLVDHGFSNLVIDFDEVSDNK